jgi:UDP-N-acetylmuramoyl-tripeptide--D-alanyl-D-alanine ligase
VLNADDDRVAAMATRAPGAVVTYGTSVDAVVRFSAVEVDDLARPRFRVESPWGRFEVALSVSGVHMATNAAAALAVTGAIGADVAAAAEALATVEMSAMRMEIRQAPSGAVIVNDAYNANPTSMRAALEAVARMRADRRIAVLGPMAELDDPVPAHREVARRAAELGLDVVVVGTDLYGVEPSDDPVGALGGVGPGDVVLVKASRSAGLERVVADLIRPA